MEHPDRPKLINLLIEFEEKLQPSINKKYRPFIKNALSLNTLSNTISKDTPIVTKELIVLKLGLESKSTKGIETSLTFLARLFEGKFVDLNLPDYTEAFLITENDVKETDTQPTRMVKDMLVKALEELVHFKNASIDGLLVRVFEHLLAQDILMPLLLLSERATLPYFNVLCSFFSIRLFYLEDSVLYTRQEMDYIHQFVPKSQRIRDQIRKATERLQKHKDLMTMYLEEVVCKVSGVGGRYGLCVVCKNSSDHFCKETRATVCSPACKQKHLEMADETDGNLIRANQLSKSVISSLTEMFTFIRSQPKNLLVFIELLDYLLKKPFLSMMVRQEISGIFFREMPFLLGVLHHQNNPKCQKLLFDIMASLVHSFKHLFLNDIEQFMTIKVIGQLEAKKPQLQNIHNIHRFLQDIFSNGQNFIELYANLDTSLNRENVMEKLMFEMARILQDRFGSGDFTKLDRVELKRNSLDIHYLLVKNILCIPFEKEFPLDINQLINEKNQKTGVEKFLLKFNASWTEGLKSLFNLNLVTLDHQEQQILDILTSVKRIKKASILQYMVQPANMGVTKRHIQRICERELSLMESLLEYYLILPLPDNIIIQGNRNDSLNIFAREYQKYSKAPNYQEEIIRWVQMFKDCSTMPFAKFKEMLNHEHLQLDEAKLYLLYSKAYTLQGTETHSYKTRTFHSCNNRKYLQLIQGQMNLIQISISHLLESQYEIPSTLSMSRLLQELCPNTSNLFSLIIKNTNMEYIRTSLLAPNNLLCVQYLIEVPEAIPDCVHDWNPILRLYNDIFYFTLGACLTPVTMENKGRLLALNPNQISINFLKISSKVSEANFCRYVNAILKIAIEETKEERTFLLEKGFNIINTDVEKFVYGWEEIFVNIEAILLKPAHPQIALFNLHSLKENLVLSKQYKLGEKQELRYFQLLRKHHSQFPQAPLRAALLETLCYAVENYFLFGEQSWIIIFDLAIQYTKDNESYHHTVYRIIEKVMSENLVLLLDFFPQLFQLLKTMCSMSSKISIKAFIDIRVLFEFLFKKTTQKPGLHQDLIYTQKAQALIQQKLPETLEWLITKFNLEVFDTCIEVFFGLIKLQIIIDDKETHHYLQKAFDQIAHTTNTQTGFLVNAESFIAEAVSLGARMKYFQILKCLKGMIIRDFNDLSILAIKGIKTFIQILNPQQESEWQDVSSVLVEIVEASRTKNIEPIEQIKIKMAQVYILDLISSSSLLPEFEQLPDTQRIMNKLIIQKSAIELLPNDSVCLPLLADIYHEVRVINENLPLRMCLWKAGFGRGLAQVPSLLSLEQIVVNRILSTYIFHQTTEEFFQFASEIFQDYSKVSQQLSNLQPLIRSSNTTKYQYDLLVLLESDLKKKKHLSQKFVRFLLPKLLQQTLDSKAKVRLGRNIVGLMGWLDAKGALVKLARKLAA